MEITYHIFTRVSFRNQYYPIIKNQFRSRKLSVHENVCELFSELKRGLRFSQVRLPLQKVWWGRCPHPCCSGRPAFATCSPRCVCETQVSARDNRGPLLCVNSLLTDTCLQSRNIVLFRRASRTLLLVIVKQFDTILFVFTFG